MSGSFLQRGEPAIIDKFHRTKAALAEGVDIVLELPYLYAVQSSNLFAEGAVRTLHESGVSSICFGSESGDADHFTEGYSVYRKNETVYRKLLQNYLDEGMAFPEASRRAYEAIGLTTEKWIWPSQTIFLDLVMSGQSWIIICPSPRWPSNEKKPLS